MNPEYFPPHAFLKSGIATSPDGQLVTMSRELFDQLVRAANAPTFDSVWYKTAYPDIAPALEEGAFPDDLTHFAKAGYEEGRSPAYFVVNTEWYLENNPDVRDAIRDEQIFDAESHFNEIGYLEGRAADAEMLEQIRLWEEAIAASAEKLADRVPQDPPTT